MSDSKKKPRMMNPEPWAHKAEWLEGEEAIRARKEVYGSIRVRMIPKRTPEAPEKKSEIDDKACGKE